MNITNDIKLTTPLSEIISSELATLFLTELSIATVGQLLLCAPKKYLMNGNLSEEDELEAGTRITTLVTVLKSSLVSMHKKQGSFLKLVVKDRTREFTVTFFNAKWMTKILIPGTRLLLAGNVKYFQGKLQLSHPNWLILPDEIGSSVAAKTGSLATAITTDNNSTGINISDFRRAIIPIYRGTSKLETWQIWGVIKQLLKFNIQYDELLTENDRSILKLPDWKWSFSKLHFPDQEQDIELAKARFSFDEALALQLFMRRKRNLYQKDRALPVKDEVSWLETSFYEQLAFKLTREQKEIIAEITADLANDLPMNRLLQGEVGTGKTVVALATMLRVCANDMQSVFLAPTEVLAEQHYQNFKKYLTINSISNSNAVKSPDVRLILLVGSMSKKEKEKAYLKIISGEANLIVGTHSLLSDKIKFLKLGYVVVDEQQRFGVEQRSELRKKGFNNFIPHLLLMTATPIPRSIALTLLGDTKISTLKELPNGKRKVVTQIVPLAIRPKWLARVWERIKEEVAKGKQVYVICFRIDEIQEKSHVSQDSSIFSAVKLYDFLRTGSLSELNLGLLHGKMTSEEKSKVMESFSHNDIQVLIATTVVEVGVDVPQASMIVVMNAEHFGVSQLHQLRGRVGRSGEAGLCLLVTGAAPNSSSFKRLQAISKLEDGFELAELDLATRKEGDILGVLQSGTKSSLRFLSLVNDRDTIELARNFLSKYVTNSEESEMEFIEQVLDTNRIEFLEKS